MMNPFFIALQNFLQKNAAAGLVLMFAAIVGAFVAAQTMTQERIENDNAHRQYELQITKNAQDIARMQAQLETFKDEMRGKLEIMNGNIIKILTLLQQEQ